MDSPNNTWRQFWIFQANPKQYDALKDLEVSRQIDWYATRFFERYRPGDVVYLWVAGEEAGIYAWAEVNGEAFRDEAGNQRLSIIYRGVLSVPVLRTQLKAQSRIFSGLTILRNATGTNFRVTASEAIEFNRIIAGNDDTPPPDPDQLEDPNKPESMYTSATYVLDFRFDSESKGIIATCLAASQSINGTFFPKLLIQTLLLHYDQQLSAKNISDFPVALNEILQLDKTREVMNFAEYISPLLGSKLSPDLTRDVRVKRNVFKILTSARRFAIKTTGKETIFGRHLVGAILNGVTTSFQNYMQDEVLGYSSMTLADVRTVFVEKVSQVFSDDRIDMWEILINEEIHSEPGTRAFTPLLTKIDSDTADKNMQDLLNIDDDAIALAKILCAKDAAPPLAIGLFGEWGSGKTFFMRRIRSHVGKLTSRVSQDDNDTGKVYHAKVAQIWFNAWNYQDGGLWASLVNHVFAGLRQELKSLNRDGADEGFATLMEKLDEERVDEKNLRESSSRLKELNERKEDAEKQIATLEKANNEIRQCDSIELSDLASVRQLENYGEVIDSYLGMTNTRKVLGRVAENSDDIKKIIDDLPKGFWARVRSWVVYIKTSPKRFVLTAMSLGLVVVAIYFIVMLAESAWFKTLGSTLTVALAVVAARLTEFGKFLSLLGKISGEIEHASRDRQQVIQQQLDSNTKEMQQLNTHLIKFNAEQATLEEEFRELNAKFGEASDETFASFIYARSESVDYTGQLGILNTIRRDFSRLNELLNDQKNKDLPKLDRIILYIDDLDRCEHGVVVDVLQAIHLMLAFPLFMVVVGVDARWLGRSLKKRYSFLVHEQDDQNHDGLDYHAASTHDYLEKIFQIPFWLRPLDGERANKMMKGLLDKKEPAKPKASSGENDRGLSQNMGNGQQDNTDVDKELFEDSEDQAENYQESDDEGELLISNLVSTRALEMTEDELAFFQQLGAVVGRSPRAVKRFINLYRIVKASHRKASIAGFSEGDGGFKAPLFLLAIICGNPKDADILFRYFVSADDTKTLVAVIHEGEQQNHFFQQFNGAGDEGEHETILNRLKDTEIYPASFNNMNNPDILAHIRIALKQKVGSQAWTHLSEVVRENADAINQLEMKTVKEWIPEVARFGYREWIE